LTQGLEQKVHERSAELERRNDELLRTRGELLEMMEKQKETNQELTTLVERLRTTQDELVRSGKLAALGALAAGVAHEINNPLAVIQGNVELLQLRAGADPGSREEVDLIARQTERMQRIVAKLLTFARQDASDAKPLDLESLVREALELAASQARNARVAVETHFALDLPPVVA
ncbi:MAG: histidine kinase dimerization/phospho-acceptor domain-containing protein, partial [Desulfotignum sp.]|nr:histidine kinase dimerization/phospho-acceptor domain-containing protein [Desulfotignum sp.]